MALMTSTISGYSGSVRQLELSTSRNWHSPCGRSTRRTSCRTVTGDGTCSSSQGVHTIKGLVLEGQARSIGLDEDSHRVIRLSDTQRRQLDVDGEECDIGEQRRQLCRH